jgi:hypothetical protein
MERAAVSYRVVWRLRVRRTIDAFAFILHETGRDPGTLQRAADEIELRLALAPMTEGESRSETERVLIVHPLSVRYQVFDEANVVLIYSGVFYPRRQL